MAIHKSFLREIGGRGIFWRHQRVFCKSFSAKNSQNFSTSKVPDYAVRLQHGMMSCAQCVPASTAMYVSMRQKIASKEVAPPINDKSSLEHSPIGTKPEQIKKKEKNII